MMKGRLKTLETGFQTTLLFFRLILDISITF